MSSFPASDTEGSFIVDRVVDIAEAAIRHLEHVANNPELNESGEHRQINWDNVLRTFNAPYSLRIQLPHVWYLSESLREASAIQAKNIPSWWNQSTPE